MRITSSTYSDSLIEQSVKQTADPAAFSLSVFLNGGHRPKKNEIYMKMQTAGEQWAIYFSKSRRPQQTL